MKLKLIKVFLFAVVISIVYINVSFAFWPWSYAPAFKGRILDVNTDLPVEEAIVEATLTTSEKIIMDESKLAITNKDGYFIVPSNILFKRINQFGRKAYLIIVIRHPMYEVNRIKLLNVNSVKDIKDIKLRALKDKYKATSILLETRLYTHNKLYTDLIEIKRYQYFVAMFKNNFNWNEYLEYYNKIIEPYKDKEDVRWLGDIFNN